MTTDAPLAAEQQALIDEARRAIGERFIPPGGSVLEPVVTADLAQRLLNEMERLIRSGQQPHFEAENARMRVAICGYVNARLAGRGSAAIYWFDLQGIAKAFPADVACRHPIDATMTTSTRGVWKCRACGALLHDDPSVTRSAPHG